MTKKLVKLRRQGPVAILSLNRAVRHNALVPELLSNFLEALESDECQQAERKAFIKQVQTPQAVDGIDRFLGG